jgi:hypothetical protein
MRSSSRSIDGHRSLTDLLPSTLDVLIRLLLHLRWLSSASAPSAWYRDRSAHAGNLQKLPHRLYVPFFLSSLFRLQTPILNQRLLLQLADTPGILATLLAGAVRSSLSRSEPRTSSLKLILLSTLCSSSKSLASVANMRWSSPPSPWHSLSSPSLWFTRKASPLSILNSTVLRI